MGNNILVEAVDNYVSAFPDTIRGKLKQVLRLLEEVKEEVKFFEPEKPEKPEKNKLANDTVVRIRVDNGDVKFWLMNHKEKGWASKGIPYSSLSEITDAWDFYAFGDTGQDLYGVFVNILK